MKIVSGEKIQICCGNYIGSVGDINYNPLIRNDINLNPDKFINIDSIYPSINNSPKVFCYTHILDLSLQKLINLLNVMENDFEIFFHNSDGNFLNCHYQQLSKIPRLKQIYSQNNTVPEVITLPIGQANSMWSHGNCGVLESVINNGIQKSQEIYYNFSVRTNATERQKCKDIIDSTGLEWVNDLNYTEYIQKLSKYKFCICPVGNGLDTHRFWECIYLNVVPICVKNKWTETIKDRVPIVILNDWNDLDVSRLDYSTFDWNLQEIY